MLYLFAIGAGLASAIQAGCTGALVKGLHNPYLVVLISLIGSTVVIALIALFFGGFAVGRAQPGIIPWWAWAAGACGAVVLLSQPVAAHNLGAATYLGLMVSAGVVTSVVLDHFGFLGFAIHPAGLWRVLGAGLMVVGVALVSRF